MLHTRQVKANHGNNNIWVSIAGDQILAVVVEAPEVCTCYGVRVDNPTATTDLNAQFGGGYKIGVDVPAYSHGETHILTVYCLQTGGTVPIAIKWLECVNHG